MSNIQMIALSKLVPGRRNVRKTRPAMSINELAASIAAHGLLQNLVVAETDTGRFSVEAGGRRLRALRKLAKAKTIAGNTAIACRVIPFDDAVEVSLAENVQREPMHPADEIEAFAELAEAGHGPEAIGSRFGVTGAHVARRLKLARVSPRLITALKTDEIDLDQLSALAFSDDHALQESAFFDAPHWQRTPEQLKARVTQAHVAETDKLARFVGVDAYVDAGGAVASDLFAEESEARYLSDRNLLLRLAEAKLQPTLEDTKNEGWGFVEVSLDGVAWTLFPERVRERRRPLTGAEAMEQERLYARLEAAEDDADIERIECEIEALAPATWDLDEIALAGAVITLSHSGEIRIERGLVRSEQIKALKALRRAKGSSENGAECEVEGQTTVSDNNAKPTIPAKLVEELLAHKTLGLRTAIVDAPDLAIRLLAFSLASAFIGEPWSTCLAVKVESADVSKSITRTDSKAADELKELQSIWRSRLPTNAADLWTYIASMDQRIVLELIAVLVVDGIDLRRSGPLTGLETRQALGQSLCDATRLDMTKYWTASLRSYFDHVRKDALIDALIEANPGLDRAALTKAPRKELLARAKRSFKSSNWLPPVLRTSAEGSLRIAAE